MNLFLDAIAKAYYCHFEVLWDANSRAKGHSIFSCSFIR